MSQEVFLIITFDERDHAKEAFKHVEKAEKEKLVEIDDAVVITKDEDGKVHAKNVERHAGKTGAKWGGVVGLLVGVGLGGPVGGAVVGGAIGFVGGALGDAYSKLLDAGVSKDQIEIVSERLQESGSALIIKFAKGDINLIRRAAEQSGGEIVELTAIDQIGEDFDDSYSASVSRDR